jgi:cyclophilin family peptidyl-prolyl cis-trans isomerase/protein-disulfide isomerase
MRKIFFPVMLILAFVLTACGNAKTPTTAPTAAPNATAVPGAPTAAVVATTAPGASNPAPTPTPFTDNQTPCKPYDFVDIEVLPASKVPIPDVTTADHVTGPENDLQCPYCGQADPIFNAVLKAFPNDVRLVFRHWPLISLHDKALQAAKAAEAAYKQGKFFEMTEFLFTNQTEWSAKSPADFTTWLNGKTTSLGLDAAKFAVDWNDPAIAQLVAADQAASDALFAKLSQAYPEVAGFGTPTLFINGSLYNDQRSVEFLSQIVNLIKNKDTTIQQCPATIIDPKKDYSATITTTKGDIVIDLLEKVAPFTVNNFVSLAQSGWYKDNVFLTVTDQYALTGDKTNTGIGVPGYAFKNEIDPAYTFDKEGVVSMYNFGPGKNGSWFFITKAPFPAIDERYTIFGVVTNGMDILKSLTLSTNVQSLASADKILSVTITAK